MDWIAQREEKLKQFPKKKLVAGIVLATCDGFVNASTLKRFGTFGGAMTGNTVKLGLSLADGKWIEAALFLSMIGGFFMGSLIAWACSQPNLRKKGSFRWLSVFVFCLFLVCEIIQYSIPDAPADTGLHIAYWRRWGSVCVAAAMGMIDVINFAGWLGQHVSFMTGNTQKLALKLYGILSFASTDGCWAQSTKSRARVQEAAEAHNTFRIVGAILLFYVVGGACGAYAANNWYGGCWSLLLPGSIVAVVIFMLEGPGSVPDASTGPKRPPLFRLFDRSENDGIHLNELRDVYERLGLSLTEEERERFLYHALEDREPVMNYSEFAQWVQST